MNFNNDDLTNIMIAVSHYVGVCRERSYEGDAGNQEYFTQREKDYSDLLDKLLNDERR